MIEEIKQLICDCPLKINSRSENAQISPSKAYKSHKTPTHNTKTETLRVDNKKSCITNNYVNKEVML